MEMRTLVCRTHGGTFQAEKKRGRPPVKCPLRLDGSGTCRKAPPAPESRSGARTAPIRGGNTQKPSAPTQKPAQAKAMADKAVRALNNSSVPAAFAARKQLEKQGWQCRGRAWFEDVNDNQEDGEACASVIGHRGDETITILFIEGECDSQHYSLWGDDSANRKGMPRRQLKFDPDEISDAELIRYIAGSPVTWWNQLGKSEETAVVSAEKIHIDHMFDGHGEQIHRIVEFVDMAGTGFRAFNVDALLKVG